MLVPVLSCAGIRQNLLASVESTERATLRPTPFTYAWPASAAARMRLRIRSRFGRCVRLMIKPPFGPLRTYFLGASLCWQRPSPLLRRNQVRPHRGSWGVNIEQVRRLCSLEKPHIRLKPLRRRVFVDVHTA